MKQIIGAFCTLFILAINVFVCAGVVTASVQTAAAKEYKADAIALIENSNFNPGVVDGCVKQAAAAGYDLRVTNCVYDTDSNIQTAEIVLEYKYSIPVLGLNGIKTTRGIAR